MELPSIEAKQPSIYCYAIPVTSRGFQSRTTNTQDGLRYTAVQHNKKVNFGM